MMKKHKIKIILLTAAIIVLFSSCQQSDSIIVNSLSGFTRWDRFFASYATYVVSEESWIDAVYKHNGKKGRPDLF